VRHPPILSILLLIACSDAPEVKPGDSTPPPEQEDSGVPPVDEEDLDQDGFSEPEDCDDEDAAVHPGAQEECNQVDDDCDGQVDEGLAQTWHADQDGDGHGDPDNTAEDCAQPDGHVAPAQADDCDDGDSTVFPGAEEICDGQDNDCDEQIDEDALQTYYWDGDDDGYGLEDISEQGCTTPEGYAEQSGDCADGDPERNPGAKETCNTMDDDCDGYADEDGVCGCAVEYWPDYEHPYQFCEIALTWDEAQAACQADGYALVTFDTEPELSWATRTVGGYASNYWWIGFTDTASEGSWVWEDASAVGYQNWCSGEPNNSHALECVSESAEDCAMLNWGSGGCWNDYPCSCDWPFYICEGLSELRPDDE